MAKIKKEKIVVIMPAYNSAGILGEVYKFIPKGEISDILLVDDGSKDNTAEVSKKLGIKTIVHHKNLGYGANQKTCYTNALKMGADFVIMLHPDDQYNPRDLPLFIKALKEKKADLIIGSRFLAGGDKETPFYKSISIRFLTFLFNLVLKTKMSELNSGYRGYTKKFLETVPFMKNGNGYIFDPEVIIQSKYFGFKTYDVPINKKYHEYSISPNFSKSVEHGLENLKLLVEYVFHKWGIRKADFLTK